MPDGDAACIFDTLLEAGITGAIPAIGGTMSPAVDDGDGVVVAPFLGLPRPGQVVMARVGTTAFIRRVIDVRMRDGRRRYLLRGDSEPGRGIDVLRENLLGRIAVVIRQGRRGSVDDLPGPRSPVSNADRIRHHPGGSQSRVSAGLRRRSR